METEHWWLLRGRLVRMKMTGTTDPAGLAPPPGPHDHGTWREGTWLLRCHRAGPAGGAGGPCLPNSHSGPRSRTLPQRGKDRRFWTGTWGPTGGLLHFDGAWCAKPALSIYQTHGGLPGHQGKFFLALFHHKCIICAKSFLPPTGRSPGRAARANIPSGCPPARCSSAGSRRRTPVTSGEEAEARLRHPPGESRHSKGTSGWPFPSILPRDRSQG